MSSKKAVNQQRIAAGAPASLKRRPPKQLDGSEPSPGTKRSRISKAAAAHTGETDIAVIPHPAETEIAVIPPPAETEIAAAPHTEETEIAAAAETQTASSIDPKATESGKSYNMRERKPKDTTPLPDGTEEDGEEEDDEKEDDDKDEDLRDKKKDVTPSKIHQNVARLKKGRGRPVVPVSPKGTI